MPEQDFVKSHYETLQSSENIIIRFLTSIIAWIMDFAQVLIIGLATMIILNMFVFSPHTIEGVSMQPNFCSGDVIITDKISPNFVGYQKGDVIVFQLREGQDLIKRIIATEGDKVKIQDGKVYVNGQEIEEKYLPEDRKTEIRNNDRMEEGVEYEVPKNHLFVLGDNRAESSDSRVFMFVNPEVNTLKGKIFAILIPLKHARLFDKNQSMPVDNCHE